MMLKNIIFKTVRFISVMMMSSLLIACAQNVSSKTYAASEVGVVAKVVPGVIVSRRSVIIDGNSGAGGLAGIAAGAAGGSAIGGSPQGQIVGAIGGAVVGGLIGNAADSAFNRHQGIEYIIQLKSGDAISVVQAANVQFQPGQHVLVIYGAMTRIIAAVEH